MACLCLDVSVKWPFWCNCSFLSGLLYLEVNARLSSPFGVNAHFLVACLCLEVNAQLSGCFWHKCSFFSDLFYA